MTAKAQRVDETIEFGAVLGTQYTSWEDCMRAATRAEELGYSSLWSADHLLSTYGPINGPRFEGYMVLAGWAHHTRTPTLGLSVGAVAFRSLALTVKLVTTLDHMSGGRAVLGIGAGWHEPEHRHYGYDMGKSAQERIAWLNEAARIMRGMLHDKLPSGDRYYTITEAPNVPHPVQQHLPIMVGGRGRRRILEVTARHGDIWNIPADVGLEGIKTRAQTLERLCREAGREPSSIRWILHCGLVVLRDSRQEAQDHLREMFRANGVGEREDLPDHGFYLGTPDGYIDLMSQYVAFGFRSINVSYMAPFDYETMQVVTHEVRPKLETRLRTARGRMG